VSPDLKPYACLGLPVFFPRSGLAFKLFKATEGAEMLLAASLDDASAYFDRVSGRTTMFAVSGERKVFRNR
jgi:hypothetical protein